MNLPPVPTSHPSAAVGPVVYVQQAPSPGTTFRAGVIFTAIFALGLIALIVFAGTQDQQSEEVQNVTTAAGLALLPGATLMAWLFVPVIGILAIITMCRDGIFLGILLLLGAPLSIVVAALLGIAIVNATQREAQTALTAKAENTPAPPAERAARFAPPALAIAATESAVEAIRSDAIAKLSRVPGLSEVRHAALLREIDIACDGRIAQISSASQNARPAR